MARSKRSRLSQIFILGLIASVCLTLVYVWTSSSLVHHFEKVNGGIDSTTIVSPDLPQSNQGLPQSQQDSQGLPPAQLDTTATTTATTSYPFAVRVEFGIVWRLCASESSTCLCESGVIRFGLRDRWLVIKGLNPAEAITCSIDALRPGTEWLPHDGKQECWCEHVNNAKPPVRVAIVTTSNRPSNLVWWINYHLDYAGIDHVFIDLSADRKTWQSLLPLISQKDKVTVNLKERASNYFLSGYQNTVVNAAVNLSMRSGIDWIVHIDDDEILYSPVKRSVGDLFANVPDRFEAIQIRNAEAIYESPEIKSCFMETKYFTMCNFVAYANGKSAARIALSHGHPKGLGVHTFARTGSKGNSQLETLRMMAQNNFAHVLPFGAAALIVIHFESCPFTSWKQKYTQIASKCEQTKCFSRFIKNFPFQKQSVQRMMECPQNSTQSVSKDPKCAEQGLVELWSSFRERKKRKKKATDKIAPLDIPWEKFAKW